MLKQTLLLAVDQQHTACVSAPHSLPGVTRWTNVKQTVSSDPREGVFSQQGRGTGKGGNSIIGSCAPPPTALLNKASANLFKLEAAAPPWTLLNKWNGSLDETTDGNLLLNKSTTQLALHCY